MGDMKHNKIKGHYVLKGKELVPIYDFMEWLELEPLKNNNITFDIIVHNEIEVSTVFLGFDHGSYFFHKEGDEEYKPLVFETMIFGGLHDGYMNRYSTYDEAVEGHKKIVAMLRKETVDSNDKNRK